MDPSARIVANLHEVRERIAAAAQRSGRRGDDITLVGVTKYVDAAATTRLRSHQAPVEFLALVPDLGLVVSAGVEGFRGHRNGLKFWDTDSGDLVAECLGESL